MVDLAVSPLSAAMVWVKRNCVTERETMRRVLRPGIGFLGGHRSLNIYRKWSVPPRTTLQRLAEVIKYELVPGPLLPGWVVGFEVGEGAEVNEEGWCGWDDHLATRFVEEQRDQTLRWFLRPAAGLDEL